jgi:hypothetical protein
MSSASRTTGSMFKRRNRPKAEDPRIPKARRRARHIATSDLYQWADESQFVYGKATAEYQKTGEQDFLYEAVFAAQVCRVIAEELYARS